MSRQEDILSELEPVQHSSSLEDDVAECNSDEIRVDDNSNMKQQEKSKSEEIIAAGILNGDAGDSGSDVETFYDFQLFAKQLQEPSAEPIIKYTKSFLKNFQTQRVLWKASEQTKLINDFKIFIYDRFSEYEPFKSLDTVMLRNAQEGIEKLIMGKLYAKCFSPCLRRLEDRLDEEHRQDLIDDDSLKSKVKEFNFIIPKDLDIPNSLSNRLDNFVKLSGRELGKINKFKAPRDKMICVLNSCKVIFGILRLDNVEEKGADNFIPLLIYTILKNEIPALASNVKYIERYRYEDFIRGEASYYLNSLQAAINFIVTLEEKALSTGDDLDFEARYQENQKSIHEEPNNTDSDSNPEGNLLSSNQAEYQQKRQNKSPMPSNYILHPLDDAANALMHKFNELFLVAKQDTSKDDDSGSAQQPGRRSSNDAENMDKLARKLQVQEQKNTLETLQAMFPEMDGGIIEDICIAKKYRVGATVDVLLSL